MASREQGVGFESDRVLTRRAPQFREKPRLKTYTPADKERAALALVHFYQSIANQGQREFSEGRAAFFSSIVLTALSLGLEHRVPGREHAVICQFMLVVSCVFAWVAVIKFCKAPGEFASSVRRTMLVAVAWNWAYLFFFWLLFRVASRWLI